jgi:hypothetical protein
MRHSQEEKRLHRNSLARARYRRKQEQAKANALAEYFREREEAERSGREMREASDEDAYEFNRFVASRLTTTMPSMT